MFRIRSRLVLTTLLSLGVFFLGSEGHVSTKPAPKELSLAQLVHQSNWILQAEIGKPPFFEETGKGRFRVEDPNDTTYRISGVRFWSLRKLKSIRGGPLVEVAYPEGMIRVIKDYELEILDPQKYQERAAFFVAPPNPMRGEANSSDYFRTQVSQTTLPEGKSVVLFLKKSEDLNNAVEYKLVCINSFAETSELSKIKAIK